MLAKFVSRLGRQFFVQSAQRAFHMAFRTPPAAEYVLPDFAEFCYARDAMPRGLNEFERGRWVGRHDVWLRLQMWLQLTEEEVTTILRGQSIFTGKDVSNG